MASASPAKKVLVPIANGKEPVEAVIAVDVLHRAGADVTVASVEKQLRVEACHGVKIIADALVSHCGQSSFDLITLPGGMPGTTNLKNSESYEHILETLFHLCHGCVYMIPDANGAFLYPKYGHGELEQAFCRCAAVKSCLQVLRRPVISLLMDKDNGQYKGVRLVSGQDLFSHRLVLDPTFTVPLPSASSPPVLPKESLEGDKRKVARGICITTRSLKPDIRNLLLVYPPRCKASLMNSFVI